MAFKQIIEGLAELKRSRDEFLHDFVRAAVDALHAGVRGRLRVIGYSNVSP